jgi:hypothetical protein
MATQERKKATTQRVTRPATTPEAREGQLTAMAMDLIERQIRDGTASSQILSHFAKAGSSREQLERMRLEQENALLQARIKALETAEDSAEMYKNALNAMRSYAGYEEDYDD